MFRTSNPALSRMAYNAAPAQTWDDLERQGRLGGVPAPAAARGPAANEKVMTVQGTVNKTFFLLTICVALALVTWTLATGQNSRGLGMALTFGGAIVGLILSLVAVFKPRTSPVVAPLYAAAEGLFLGGISAWFAASPAPGAAADVSTSATSFNGGLVFNAILLTFGIAGALCLAYTARLIRPGPVFRNTVIVGTLGVCLYGLIAFVASLFGAHSLASVYDPSNGGLISIGFSLLVVVLASANLVLDFDFIESAAQARAPRYMEWFGAFGLLVTLVWLYIEVLRLLAKLRSSE
ncbi:MAG: Bax inhibitor-1/YccA family protein [Planctomycetota bacterium]|nr:Bax inhibitor-1/YccA family protein [Planctomycetota bacterium]